MLFIVATNSFAVSIKNEHFAVKDQTPGGEAPLRYMKPTRLGYSSNSNTPAYT